MRLLSSAALVNLRIRSRRLRITEDAEEKLDGGMGLGLLGGATRVRQPRFRESYVMNGERSVARAAPDARAISLFDQRHRGCLCGFESYL
jgi:hypothetical protein